MKKKGLIAFVVAGIMVLSGCGDKVPVDKKYETETISMFVEVERTFNWTVVYHKDTKVMYAVSYVGEGVKGNGSFTLLVNADGTPMTWKG